MVDGLGEHACTEIHYICRPWRAKGCIWIGIGMPRLSLRAGSG